MKLKCLATGSNGNCYALIDGDGKILLLDCGLPIKEIKAGIDFRVSDIVGCLITHAHMDHSKSESDLKKMGIPVITPYKNKVSDANFGNFFIRYFALTDKDGRFAHSNADGSECPVYGYIIMHNTEKPKLLYLTDCEFCKWRFSGMENLLIGINYADESFTEHDNEMKKRHVMNGHMELKTACEFIKVTDRDKTLKNVIVGHMSEHNSDKTLFTDKIAEITSQANIFISEKGLVIDL